MPTSPDEFVRADRAITWLSRVPRPSAVGAGNPVTGAARDCSLIFEGKPITLQVPNAAKFRALLDGVPLEMKPGTHPDSGVLTVPHPGRLVIEER
ncbi:MAG: hypothetical protein HYY93_10460 [Planctomycetes bacterium]|nr:hypothetical protein [Planctomycetota bacterium]